MRTDPKVSPIRSSDRSEAGALVSWASKRSALRYLERLSHVAADFGSGSKAQAARSTHGCARQAPPRSRLRRTDEPQQHGDPSGLGPTVTVRYDPADPEHVITGASTAARDITFSIVALKLLIGGPVFMAFGYRRLRAAAQRHERSSSTPV